MQHRLEYLREHVVPDRWAAAPGLATEAEGATPIRRLCHRCDRVSTRVGGEEVGWIWNRPVPHLSDWYDDVHIFPNSSACLDLSATPVPPMRRRRCLSRCG